MAADLHSGELQESDPLFAEMQVKTGLHASNFVEAKDRAVTAIQTEIKKHVGATDYAFLEQISAGSKEVRDLLTKASIDRLMGRGKASWSQIVQLVKDWDAGRK